MLQLVLLKLKFLFLQSNNTVPKLNNKGLTHWEKNVSKHGDFFDELVFEGSLIF